MFSVELRGQKEMASRLEELPSTLRVALRRKMYELALRLEALVKRKLTNDVLNVVTGALRASISHRVEESGAVIKATVFSSGDVKYAAIHEYGGKIPPHDIYPNKARALAFVVGGKQVFAAHVHHPGSTMPERSFLRSSLTDMREDIIRELRQVVVQATSDSVHGK